jgi:hypothetical protein
MRIKIQLGFITALIWATSIVIWLPAAAWSKITRSGDFPG